VRRTGLSWSVLSALAAIAAVLGCTVPATAGTIPGTAVVARPAAPADTGPLGVIMGAGSAISCPTAATCLAVGEGTSGTGAWKSIAEARRSGHWKAVTVKPPGSTAKLGNLLGVSCQTAGYCLAVGLYGPDEWAPDLTPYAAAWTGSSLTPVARLPVPASLSTVEATAVSCVAAASCVVIGTGFDQSAFTTPGGFLGYVTCIWTWNRGKWAVRMVPDKANDGMLSYSAIHCFSLASCVTAGLRAPQSGSGFDTGDEVPLLATWNGKTLTAMKPALPSAPAGTARQFASVSCVSLSSCAVVGVSSGTSTTSFLDVWNGKTWRLTRWSGPRGTTSADLYGVSCPSASRCLAVGSVGAGVRTAAAALAFNGVTWTATKVPGPAKGKLSVFNGVSCPKVGDCVAIGNVGAVTASSPLGQLAGYWNGKTWQLSAA
jgi:hypothetical protein